MTGWEIVGIICAAGYALVSIAMVGILEKIFIENKSLRLKEEEKSSVEEDGDK